jgi:cysteate synthase
MLNITGGGEQRFKDENELFYLKPSLVFDMNPKEEDVKKKLNGLSW